MKQQEIREGIARHYYNDTNYGHLSWVKCPSEDKEMYYGFADEEIRQLHAQGVVRKVKRELPERVWYNDWGGESGKAGYDLCKEDMAGCAATEPLIED